MTIPFMPLATGAWALLLIITTIPVRAQDRHWNQFRGPQGNGNAEGAALPTTWSEETNVTWKTPLPGKAWSSPVVWGDAVWVTSATEDGKELYALGIDVATGKLLHNVTVFQIAEPEFCYPYNSYASSTPVIEAGRLWVHYGSAGTACLDTNTGAILWSRQDLPCNHHRGPGSSPIIHGDLLIVHFDGYDLQYVVALNKHTGETVWKKDRSLDYGTDEGDAKKAYSTPTVIEHEGRVQLISPAAVGTIAYDPLTGEELWKVYHGGFNAAARPLYSHGLVILNLEGGDRMIAVRPDGTGDVTSTHVVWKNQKATPTRPSQLIIGEHLYMVNDAGIVSCLNMATGEPVWTHRVGGRFSASPIHAQERVFLFDEEGQSHVIAADPAEFRPLATNHLDAGCMASPAVTGDALLLRTKTHLYRLETR